jgi:hypothetical protein
MRLQDLGLFVFIFLAAGCASAPKPVINSFDSPLVELNLITAPVALNLDNQPGVDGFSTKVYANNARNPKPVPIASGQLDIVIFDGTLFGKTNLPSPLRTWSFTAGELKAHQFEASIGTGYDFVLAWGPNRPTQRMISVAARYTSPDGRIITSFPSSVMVVDR